MKRSSRPRSALFRELDRSAAEVERLEGPRPPNLRPEGSGEAEIAWAFCPLLKEATGVGTCGDVDCAKCIHMDRHLREHHPDHIWVCSTCTAELRVLPYWAGGECECCGFASSVLMLAVPLE
jgi:hypothetical protein